MMMLSKLKEKQYHLTHEVMEIKINLISCVKFYQTLSNYDFLNFIKHFPNLSISFLMQNMMITMKEI
jgi:hypothetical protein